MKKILKTFYILLVVLLWLVVLSLSAELGTRILLRTANYLYKPLFEHQTSKVYRMVRLSEELKRITSNRESTQHEPYEDTIFNKTDKTSPTNETCVCDKNYELTLQGKAEIHLDEQGNITQSYGDPVIERYIHNRIQGLNAGYYSLDWNLIIEHIKHPTSDTFSMKVKYENFFVHYYQVDITSKDKETIVIASEIRDGYPLSLKLPNSPIDENSPWLIPFFMYKPNWGKAGDISQYNNLGFRDNDIIIPKPEGVFRIVCVGGSTTEEGNSNDMTYPNIMERKLNKYFQTDKIDVINAGICGIRSIGEVRRINDYLALQPDLIVYYNAFNDIFYHDIPFWLQLPNRYREIISHSSLLNRIFNRKLLPSDEYIADYFRKTILRNLGAMNCACKKQNVPMAICSFAYPQIKWYEFVARLYYDFNIRNVWLPLENTVMTFDTYVKVIEIYNRELKKFCEEEQILYIPVAEEFHAGADHFFDVCHMTPIGLDVKTDIIGSHIARWIEKQHIFEKKDH